MVGLLDFLLDVRVLDGDQRTQGGVAVLADAGIEAGKGALVPAQPLDLFEVELGRLGELIERRLLLELDRQLTLDASELACPLGTFAGRRIVRPVLSRPRCSA